MAIKPPTAILQESKSVENTEGATKTVYLLAWAKECGYYPPHEAIYGTDDRSKSSQTFLLIPALRMLRFWPQYPRRASTGESVIPAGEHMLRREPPLAGTQVEKPLPWDMPDRFGGNYGRLAANDNNLGPGKRRFMPLLDVVTPG